MDSSVELAYEFGSFRLDPSQRVLMHGHERLDLPPRVFDTLLALLQSSGRVLTKDDLMRTVWPDTTVEENNLSQAVYLLRKVLHDGENGTRYIETVPKRGYRFVARVELTEMSVHEGMRSLSPASTDSTDQKSLSSHPAIPNPRTAHRILSPWNLGLLTGLAVILLVVALRGWRNRDQSDSQPIRSVAVLPLQNLSNDPEQEYFADGMTDELITDLAQVRELKVVSKTSIMQYKGVHRPLPEIGRELGVDAVVEGSVLRSGNRVRITAQLIRTATDRHIWAKAYEGDLKNVLSLQALVAEAITGEVRISSSVTNHERFKASRAVDPEVYEAYLRGRYFWNRRDVEGFQKANEFFNQAIKKDPNFALAYAGVADCDTLLALDTLGPGLMAEAKVAALKAIALDDGLAEAHTSLAAVKIFLDWDWQGAESELKRALELNPNYAPAHHWYGNILLGPLARHEEAIAQLKRARDLDPLSLIINADLGYAYYLARQYDSAFAQYQKVLAMDRNFVPVHSDLSKYYAQKGMYDDWIRENVEDLMLAGYPQTAKAMQDFYTTGGFRRVMSEMAASRGTLEATTGASHQKGSFCTAAESYAGLNETQLALAALQQCYKQREPGLIYLKVEPVWDSLRAAPAFQELEHRMGLK
jgi:TolB-like protein/DNA-binding winged helix-turn-helix (wHTH) protein/Tfp pilus assembly protein PilF